MGGRGAIIGAAVLGIAVTLVAGATAKSEATSAGSSYEVVGKWGTAGDGNGQFGSNAFGLATDKRGVVYVADTDNHRIQIFSPSGAFQGKIPFEDSVVRDVAIDADGNVWGTTDTETEARRFTPDGRPLGSVATPKQAAGIGADAEGNIYVATYGDEIQLVVRYDKPGDEYTQAESWGGFRVPSDVEVSPDGTIWVSDSGALNVKRFDANGKALTTIKGGAVEAGHREHSGQAHGDRRCRQDRLRPERGRVPLRGGCRGDAYRARDCREGSGPQAQGRGDEHDRHQALESAERQGDVQDRAQDERAPDHRDAQRDGGLEVADRRRRVADAKRRAAGVGPSSPPRRVTASEVTARERPRCTCARGPGPRCTTGRAGAGTCTVAHAMGM
jgi:hypothetical protein